LSVSLVRKLRGRGVLAVLALASGVLLLNACGPFGLDRDGAQFSSAEYGVTASPRVTRSLRVERGGGRAIVGDPYRVAGRWYTPEDDPNYSAVGTASWYGSAFHGRLTANGEVFDMNGITGAHPTLPLPSYVRVTNLQNGRSVVVRLNDRGPYTHNRLIDLSGRAADLLDFRRAGTAQVQVDYLGRAPLEGDDTRQLLASYNNPNGPSGADAAQAILRAAPRETPPSRGGILGRLFGGTLFGYAEEGDPRFNAAYGAASAMSEGQESLASWQAANDLDSRTLDVTVGTFDDAGRARDIAIAFAVLASVDLVPAELNGAPATAVKIVLLKPGVTRDDLNVLAGTLGLGDIVLY